LQVWQVTQVMVAQRAVAFKPPLTAPELGARSLSVSFFSDSFLVDLRPFTLPVSFRFLLLAMLLL
jgi:hypothetical protein